MFLREARLANVRVEGEGGYAMTDGSGDGVLGFVWSNGWVRDDGVSGGLG